MSAQSSGQTPRSSISSLLSLSSSSSPITKRNKDPGSFDSRVDQYNNEVEDGDELRVHEKWIATQGQPLEMEEELYEDRRPKRQRPRNSGGFLLQSSAPLQSSEISARNSISSDVAKGKRKAEEGDLIITKRTPARRLHKPVGGSPLASEITTGQDALDSGAFPEKNRHGVDYSSSEKMASAGSRSSTGPERINHQRSALGQNTDTADIVNLALNLSESRRRNVSGASMLIPRDTGGSRRMTSINKPTLGIPYGTSGGSLRQHLREQRRISRNISPRSSGSASRRDEKSPPQTHNPSSRQSSELQAFEIGMADDVAFNASDATLARAAKARAALELGYEYRRLLQYLPAIPRITPNTSKATGRDHAQMALGLGRAYNPLQYIRNRKVRFRDKKPLNPELDGWKDVDRVRSWVDAVKSEREIGISRVDDRFPLPPFDAIADQPTVVDSTESSYVPQSKPLPVAQPARPSIDWTFASSDLLADVYWLDQDRNLERIEDRSWRKIIRTPGAYKGGPSGKYEDSPISPVSRQSTSLSEQDTSPEQVRDVNINGFREVRERGRRRKGHHEPKSSVDLEDGPHAKRSRWPKSFLRSRSSSSGSQTDWSGRSRRHHGLKSQNNFDNAALEKHMLEMLAQEAQESKSIPKAMNGQAKKTNTPNHYSSWLNESMQPKNRKNGSQRPEIDMSSVKSSVPSTQQSPGTKILHRRISSEDLRTAPTSPIVPGLAPSIAVDMSPPESLPNHDSHPTLSPPKRPLPSRLGSFRRDRSRSVGIGSASENDASKDQDSSSAISRQVSSEPQPSHQINKQRSTDPLNGSLMPYTNDLPSMRTRAQEPRPARASKDANYSDSRFRGFFKGGRIAELVGNEVSKVGDIIWRKDGNYNTSQLASPAASAQSSDASDQEDQGNFHNESSPSDNLSRVTTNADNGPTRVPKASSERQKYYMGNLPSFRSRNDQSSTLAASLPNEDHISRQQRMMKERGRSFKFDSLAPPKIDMRSVSTSPPPGISRSQSRGPAKEQSRDSSGSRSTRGVRDADKKLNDVLGVPGRVGTGKVAPTGLAALASSSGAHHSRGRPEIKRQWSISDRGISAVRGAITKRDIARVRALLLSSGIKAAELCRRNEEIPTQASALLQGLQHIIEGPIPLLPPSQEIIFAALALTSDIERNNKQLRDEAEGFTKGTVEDLHNQIKMIDEQANYKFTPLVRAAADDADAFSAELTTTHTLAVRQLNDSLDTILRRRRRRLRWIRRCGWALLEWTVLGVMWMVWLIAVIVRVIRCIVEDFVLGVRWLFFL